jgi:cell division protein ZapA
LTKAIQVEIYGQHFTISGEAEEAYVRQLAAFVDQQMRSLASGAKTATLGKVAVLTAVNIAHQLFQIEAQRHEHEADLDRQAGYLMESIEEHLQAAQP